MAVDTELAAVEIETPSFSIFFFIHLYLWDDFISVEAAQLFSQRKGNLQMNFLDYCLEPGLYMGKYSSLSVR
jgi:hypothetical protein